eukprot:CCRYP_013753-RA/>CCRYP_013753-RA protein AED:0.00 eAED:0.00 QI:77/1/1/1/0/0/2/68/87
MAHLQQLDISGEDCQWQKGLIQTSAAHLMKMKVRPNQLAPHHQISSKRALSVREIRLHSCRLVYDRDGRALLLRGLCLMTTRIIFVQ